MIYKVALEFRGRTTYEIEASDDEYAEERAVDLLHDEGSGFDFIETIDAVVTTADDQYSAIQESIDDDRRHEDKD